MSCTGASGSGVVLCDPPDEAALPAPVFEAHRDSAVGLRLAVLRPDADAPEGRGMSLFNTHPLALYEFRRGTDRGAARAHNVSTYAYKCKKCGAEMQTMAGRRKYQFGGWICPECAAK